MKKTFYLSSFLLLFLCLSVIAQEAENTTKIKIKVQDADGRLIEKEFDSEEALRNDPELQELGINVITDDDRFILRSPNEHNRIMIYKGKGEGDKGFEYRFDDEGRDIFLADSTVKIFHRRFGGDTLMAHRPEEVFFRLRDHEGEIDSLLRHKRMYVFEFNDSTREAHFADMERHREQMRQHMDKMREHMREMEQEFSEGTRFIIIREFNKEESDRLNLKEESLKLSNLSFYPNPSEGHLKLRFEAKEDGPVQIKLLDAQGQRTLYDETRQLSNGSFEETIDIEQYEPGMYILQIIQNGKVLSRRVMMR